VGHLFKSKKKKVGRGTLRDRGWGGGGGDNFEKRTWGGCNDQYERKKHTVYYSKARAEVLLGILGVVRLGKNRKRPEKRGRSGVGTYSKKGVPHWGRHMRDGGSVTYSGEEMPLFTRGVGGVS